MASNSQEIKVSCTTEYPAYKPSEMSKCWGLVTLKASHYECEESIRPALDIVAVIDRSGSMRGEKLFLVKKSLKFLVQNLLENDRLSVITYDTGVTVEFDLLSMNKDNKEYAESKIGSIESGSSTNLCGGLLQGLCTILERGNIKNDVASVLLFTDGLANHGITRKEKIIEAMKNPRKYLNESDSDVPDLDMMIRYQANSTPAMSCNSIPSQHQSGPSPHQSAASRGSFFGRSLRKIVNYFGSSTAEEAPTQSLSSDEENEQGNEVNIQQNIEPQPAQILQVQQPLLTQNVQPAETLPQPDPQQVLQQSPEIVQQQEEEALPPEEVLQPKEVLQPEQTLQPEEALQPKEALQPEEALQQPAQVIEPAPPESQQAVNEEKKNEVDTDASVYTFGFGRDHDPDMLKAISDAANGMYYFIENEEQISESFGHCFGGLVSTLGQNIELTLELYDGVTIDTIHTDRNYTSDNEKIQWKVQLGDIQSDEERDILLVINLPFTDSSTTTILKSSIKYFCVVDSSYKCFKTEMSVNRSADAKFSSEIANLAIDRQRNRILAAKATKEALKLADNGDLELARQRLKEEINRVKESLTKDDELCKLLIQDLEKSLEGLRDKHLYHSYGKKYQMNLLQMHSQQRSSRTTSASGYENVSQISYMRKFK